MTTSWFWNYIPDTNGAQFMTPEGIVDLERMTSATIHRCAERGWARQMLGDDNRAADDLSKHEWLNGFPVLNAHSKAMQRDNVHERSLVETAECTAADQRRFVNLDNAGNFKGYHHKLLKDLQPPLRIKCGCGRDATRRHWLHNCGTCQQERRHFENPKIPMEDGLLLRCAKHMVHEETHIANEKFEELVTKLRETGGSQAPTEAR